MGLHHADADAHRLDAVLVVDVAVAAAGHLSDLVRTSEVSERKNHYRNIKLCETQGDAVITTLYEEMVEIKSTPFDRADVQALAAMLDDFLDMINDSAKRIIIFA